MKQLHYIPDQEAQDQMQMDHNEVPSVNKSFSFFVLSNMFWKANS